MRLRGLVLLLLLYVTLDFGNPMIPGAVSFDADASTEGIHRDRGRVTAVPALPSILPRVNTTVPAPRTPPVRVVAAPARGVWIVPLPRARAGTPSSSPSSPSDEH